MKDLEKIINEEYMNEKINKLIDIYQGDRENYKKNINNTSENNDNDWLNEINQINN